MTPPPQIIIIAGPNGAGKSTSATLLVPPGFPFVNADEIAKGLTDLPIEQRNIRAGRIMLTTLEELEARRQSFAIETTLASRPLLKRIERLKAAGYSVYAIYMGLQNVELSIQRVAERVRRGGHNVPEGTIRRRFLSSLDNFRKFYRLEAGGWMWFDNSQLGDPKLVGMAFQATNKKADKTRYRKHDFAYEIAHGAPPEQMLFGGRYLFHDEIKKLVRQAVREAVLDHKRAGNPVAAWKDGKVAIIPPEEIEVPKIDERQPTFDNKWVYADLHKVIGPNGELALGGQGTWDDLKRHGIDLKEGLNLTLWMDDADDHGNPDPLVFFGTLHFKRDENYWLAAIDYLTMRHASRLSSAEIDTWVMDRLAMAMAKQRQRKLS